MKLLAKLHAANDDILASQAFTFSDEGLAQSVKSSIRDCQTHTVLEPGIGPMDCFTS